MNKKIEENVKSKNSFLVTCAFSIFLLLTLCYLGINGNSSVKGTLAAGDVYGCPTGTKLVDNKYCCPSHLKQVTEFSDGTFCTLPEGEYSVDFEVYNTPLLYFTSTNIVYKDTECRVFVKSEDHPEGANADFKVTFNGYSYNCPKSSITTSHTGVKYFSCSSSSKDACVVRAKDEVEYACFQFDKYNPSTKVTSSIYDWIPKDEYKNKTGYTLMSKYTSKTDCHEANSQSCYKCSNPTTGAVSYEWGYDYNASNACVKVANITSKANCKKSVIDPDPEPEPEVIKYTVTYNANGGKVNGSNTSTESCTVTGNSTTCTISPLPTPTRSGYTFNGWITNVSSCNTIGGTKTQLTMAKNTTVYACWNEKSSTGGNNSDPEPNPKTYIGTFMNGVNQHDSESCTTSGSSSSCYMPVPGTNPTKSGYTFTGWGTSDGCSSGVKSSFSVSSNVTRYACWTKNNVETPKPDDEQNVDNNPQTGEIAIFMVWVIGLATVAYSAWYFNKLKKVN